MALRILRSLIWLVVPIFALFVALDINSEESGEVDESGKVVSTLNFYFVAAREYSMEKMVSVLARSVLEDYLKAILLPGQDSVRDRSVRLAFNNYFLFAGSCKSVISDIHYDTDVVQAEVSLRRDEGADRYQFFLVNENGSLKISHFEFLGKDNYPQGSMEINVCDIPINWENPAVLRPDETVEQQRERLGIR